jgi:release factor glutamine methyltransferase
VSTPSPPPESLIVDRLRAAGCVFAEEEARLLVAAPVDPAELESMVARRVAGQPLEHILGWAEFSGLRIRVAPGVFVPRRRTAFLALEAIALTAPGSVVLDLCCGSGALGAAVAAAVPGIELFASDIEPAAVACARDNLPTATVVEGDLFDSLPGSLRGRVDVLVCNTPYVPTDEIGMLPPEARDFEPRVTLDGGADGLDVQRRVAARASEWLATGGHVLVEVGAHQAAASAALFSAHGLAPRITSSDEHSATVVVATRA